MMEIGSDLFEWPHLGDDIQLVDNQDLHPAD